MLISTASSASIVAVPHSGAATGSPNSSSGDAPAKSFASTPLHLLGATSYVSTQSGIAGSVTPLGNVCDRDVLGLGSHHTGESAANAGMLTFQTMALAPPI